MGYTHRYRYVPTDSAFREAWPRVIADAQQIVERVEAAGVALEGEGGRPVTEQRILLNGDSGHELDCEPLQVVPDTDQLMAFEYDEHGVVRTFCKTNRLGYDLAVCAILLRCHRLAPNSFFIGSDGQWGKEWLVGTGDPTLAGLSARGIVAELFGDTPTADPFVL